MRDSDDDKEREASGMAGAERGLGTPVLLAQSLDSCSPSLSSASGPGVGCGPHRRGQDLNHMSQETEKQTLP